MGKAVFSFCEDQGVVVVATLDQNKGVRLRADDLKMYDTESAKTVSERADIESDLSDCQRDIDAGKAMISEEGKVIIFQEDGSGSLQNKFYKVKKSVFDHFVELYRPQISGNKIKTVTLSIEDTYCREVNGVTVLSFPDGTGVYEAIMHHYHSKGQEPPSKYTIEDSGVSSVIDSMSGGKSVNKRRSDRNEVRSLQAAIGNTYHKESKLFDLDKIIMGSYDTTPRFACSKKSDALFTAKVLYGMQDREPPCIELSDGFIESKMGQIKYEIDKRYPYTYVPCIYKDTPSYIIPKQSMESNGRGTVIEAKEPGWYFHIYSLDLDSYKFLTDALPEAVASDSNLQKNVTLGEKCTMILKGSKNIFNAKDEEAQEKIEKSKKLFADVLNKLCTAGLKITHVSYATGLITAYTKSNKQVLIIAAQNIKYPEYKSHTTFIPMAGGLGLCFIGLTGSDLQVMKAAL